MTTLLTHNETWTDVCPAAELLPGRGVAALVDGQPVAVFLLADGRVFALANRDPWSGADVLSRGIVGSLGGRVVIASPMYKQHVDLETGRGIEHPDVVVPTFLATVGDGRVRVGPPVPSVGSEVGTESSDIGMSRVA